jgi:hypothetical protein
MPMEEVWKQNPSNACAEEYNRNGQKTCLCLRISATDWADGGWNAEESVKLSTI